MICLTCGKEFFEDYRKDERLRKTSVPKYCSRACSNSRSHSIEYKERISSVMKDSQRAAEASAKRRTGIEKICPICGTTFYVPKVFSRKTYCSRHCYNQDHNKKNHLNLPSGGYREGSGNSKSGRYKGIYCGSTYELIWVIYQIDHDLSFSRFPGRLTSEDKVYIPDFLQNEQIVEIKGYYSNNVEKQKYVAENNGYKIIFKYKKDLEKEFIYFQEKYKLPPNKAYLLYDT